MSPLIQARIVPWTALVVAVGFDVFAPAVIRSALPYAVPIFLSARSTTWLTVALTAVAIVMNLLDAVLGRSPLGVAVASGLVFAALAVIVVGHEPRRLDGSPGPPESIGPDPENRSTVQAAAIPPGSDTRPGAFSGPATLDPLPTAAILVDLAAGQIIDQNAAFERLVGSVVGYPHRRDVDGLSRSGLDDLLARAREHGAESWEEEVALVDPDGRRVPTLVRAMPLVGGTDGNPAVVLTLTDVRGYARRLDESARLLDASAVLASSLDLDSTLTNLTRLLVARLADWCVVDVARGENTAARRVVAHRDAELDQTLRERSHPSADGSADAQVSVGVARSRGGPVATRSPLEILGLPNSVANEELSRALQYAGAIRVPLLAGDEVIGTIVLARARDDFDAAEVAFAEEIGRRAGQSVDLARRFDLAQRAGEMRRRFLTVASHELRTPVTSLLGYAQVELRRVSRHGSLDPERVVATLQAIERQARNLALVISRLLDVTMIDGGQVTLDREAVDVAALVTKVATRVRRQTSRHILLMEAPPNLVAYIDPFWIEKVLLNLLDNAIRYSPEGGPIEVALEESAPASLNLTVRDYGIGVPSDQLERIFDRYAGAHEDSNRSGIGLGLSICRQIVEMHGGRIHAEVPETGGTRLLVALPIGGPNRSVSGGA